MPTYSSGNSKMEAASSCSLLKSGNSDVCYRPLQEKYKLVCGMRDYENTEKYKHWLQRTNAHNSHPVAFVAEL